MKLLALGWNVDDKSWFWYNSAILDSAKHYVKTSQTSSCSMCISASMKVMWGRFINILAISPENWTGELWRRGNKMKIETLLSENWHTAVLRTCHHQLVQTVHWGGTAEGVALPLSISKSSKYWSWSCEVLSNSRRCCLSAFISHWLLRKLRELTAPDDELNPCYSPA